MNQVGYKLSGPDNGTYMLRKEDSLERCETCKYRLDFLAVNPHYRLRKLIDFSVTYDGYWIVSIRFRDFCLREGYQDLVFTEFQNDKNHFNFSITRVVKFDAVRRNSRFEKLCPTCENYESIVGADPSYLVVSEPLADGFYRSDLLFGSGDAKHPLIFIGSETKTKLEAARLTRLDFSPAFGLEID